MEKKYIYIHIYQHIYGDVFCGSIDQKQAYGSHAFIFLLSLHVHISVKHKLFYTVNLNLTKYLVV